MTTVKLPTAEGSLEVYRLGDPRPFARPSGPLQSRRALAAAHVVADPLADNTPGRPATLDWEATMSFRRHLWSWGLSVADAMDTAQRGMGLDWETTKELVRRSAEAAAEVGGDIACGASTDQVTDEVISLDDVIAAYVEQISYVEGVGSQAVMMASRHLARVAEGPDDYAYVYGRVLREVERPVIIHWLGEMFDPALSGYWGSANLDEATESFLEILAANGEFVDGVKISLLDQKREVSMRRRLPDGMKMYTGDDFDYPTTIGGDDEGFSYAFLGAFDLIAPAASAAIQALDRGDPEGFHAILEPTVELSRHVFGHPTFYYKTGVVFMAFLNGHQDHFRMVGGLEASRSVLHLTRQFVRADEAGLLADPELAAARMSEYLALAGVR